MRAWSSWKSWVSEMPWCKPCVAEMPELDEAFRRRRHPHLPADPQKQRLAELLLEQENLAADRRLRDVQLAPAPAERSGLGDRLKDFELPEVHVRPRRPARASRSP